ncbi:aldehyde ferredoxin oxidoreductase family protein [Desulfosudis oleivorans]|uniref:Aldehyde ferredoxin oxidoreductase n=1 Tax=Desulfosudis oleivorans (strain DSM 6200 / JCM 39069 / Hxd3) TaxID=96561 RepID=A9A0V0_DESOH|nr:aldehyde ferredoxin oxidoreductase family protein [Desulfosudis oleivorans]ABW67575.1 Aldehyde ferredoxin oxidoreductase [Desulfosudis oleivorans Hxd3]
MKKEMTGTSNRILEIDLSSGKSTVFKVPESLRTLYLGGKGLGLKLIFDRMNLNADPLGPENILAFMPGVLMGTGAPCTGRFAAVTKSPQTGIMATASCGGAFGMQLKTAGWDGLLVTGTAQAPVYLMITADGAEIRDAGDLWGLETTACQQRLAADKNTGVLAIGPAGENRVRFANIASGHRFLGRGGMGAVMGAKNLKAVVAKGGDFKILPVDPALFEKTKQKAARYIKGNAMTSATYTTFGTRANVTPSNRANILPINNFFDGQDDRAVNLSGEVINKAHHTSHSTCKPCSILCGQKGEFGGEVLPVPEFETVGLLGSNIGIFDTNRIAEFNRVCGEMGMDTISAGGTLAWVMEAAEKGMVESPLRFGAAEGVSQALLDIAHCRGFGAEMAEGVRVLSEKYGGKEFAMHVKGMEMAAYDPRGSVGQGLAYAVANRGACHLSAYMIAQEIYFKLLDPYRTRAKPEFVKFFESITCCVNSLHTCQFTMFAYLLEPPSAKYSPDLVLGFFMQNVPEIAIRLIDFSVYTRLWSAVTGIPMSNGAFLAAGDRIHVLERYMNTRMGISRKDDTLPGRLLMEGRASDPRKRVVPLDKMLSKYYKLRGFDDNGIPTEKTLKRLGIAA